MKDYYNEFNYGEAIKCFLHLVAADPDNLRYYHMLGASYHLAGRRNEAVAAWSNCMKVQARLAEKADLPASPRYLPGIFTQAIGHIACVDIWAKRQLLGLSTVERYIIQAPHGYVANASYLDLWRHHFEVTTGEEPELTKQSSLLGDNITVVSLAGDWLWFLDAACEIQDRWCHSSKLRCQMGAPPTARRQNAVERSPRA